MGQKAKKKTERDRKQVERMIKLNYHFKAYQPRNVTGGKTVFNIGHKGKDGKMRFVTIMCDSIDLIEKEEIKITEIKGMEQNSFENTKKGITEEQITLYCTVVKKTEPPKIEQTGYYPDESTGYYPDSTDDFNTGPLIDISSDDLPF